MAKSYHPNLFFAVCWDGRFGNTFLLQPIQQQLLHRLCHSLSHKLRNIYFWWICNFSITRVSQVGFLSILNDGLSFPGSRYKPSISHVVGRPVSEVVDASFGLAFQVYPEAISKMYGAPIWSILFFIMLITLGLG